MDAIVTWFTSTIGQHISKELCVFVISLFPLLECRGGLIAAKLLEVPLLTAIPICVIGNILPIPFILLFIKKILNWMAGTKHFHKIADWVFGHAKKRSGRLEKSEFMGLLLFVGIPLPGTGAWTGSLIAALLDMDLKKSVIAELIGIAMATVIISSIFYGLLGMFL